MVYLNIFSEVRIFPVRSIVFSQVIAKRKISLKYKKIRGVKGYQIRWCDNKKFQGYLQKTTAKTSVVLKGLSKKEKYSIKVRAYKLSGKKKVYGAWSRVRTVKVKK